jgi:hypothetical protein
MMRACRFCWLVIAFLSAAAAQPPVPSTPDFMPIVEPYAHIFPALEMAYQGLRVQPQSSAHRIGIRLLTPTTVPLLLNIDAAGLFHDQQVIPAGARDVQLSDASQWDWAALGKIGQARMQTVRFDLRIFSPQNKNTAARSKTLNVRVHASNEVLLGVEGQADFNWSLAAFVDENSPVIAQVLSAAKRSGVVHEFTGYQAGSEEVYAQVFAIWHALQRRGMRYSTLTVPVREHPALLHQPVRSVAQSWREKRANCVDGSVLIASSLQHVGIRSALVILPGHMLLGVALDARGQEWMYLESTQMGLKTLRQGSADVANLVARTGNDLSLTRSLDSFESALASGDSQVQDAGSAFYDPGNINYQIIDLFAARKRGIQAITLDLAHRKQ